MSILKYLTDPLGNTIMISTTNEHFASTEKLITHPAFIIQLGPEALYYFRIIDWEMNMLIATKTDQEYFIAESCIQHPNSEYISLLIKKGGRVISSP